MAAVITFRGGLFLLLSLSSFSVMRLQMGGGKRNYSLMSSVPAGTSHSFTDVISSEMLWPH